MTKKSRFVTLFVPEIAFKNHVNFLFSRFFGPLHNLHDSGLFFGWVSHFVKLCPVLFFVTLRDFFCPLKPTHTIAVSSKIDVDHRRIIPDAPRPRRWRRLFFPPWLSCQPSACTRLGLAGSRKAGHVQPVCVKDQGSSWSRPKRAIIACTMLLTVSGERGEQSPSRLQHVALRLLIVTGSYLSLW